jgi:hypothetical protein
MRHLGELSLSPKKGVSMQAKVRILRSGKKTWSFDVDSLAAIQKGVAAIGNETAISVVWRFFEHNDFIVPIGADDDRFFSHEMEVLFEILPISHERIALYASHIKRGGVLLVKCVNISLDITPGIIGYEDDFPCIDNTSPLVDSIDTVLAFVNIGSGKQVRIRVHYYVPKASLN